MTSSVSRLVGYGCAALGAAFFSTKAIFIKLAFEEQVDASLMLAYRMIFATPVFVAIGVWAYAKRRAKGEPPPDRRSVAYAAFIGFLGILRGLGVRLRRAFNTSAPLSNGSCCSPTRCS